MTPAEQAQAVRRRLVRATAEPHLDRLRRLTKLRQPDDGELLDALLLASMHPTESEPVERVWRCWNRWRLVMSDHESFGTYARRNMQGRWR